MKRWDSVLNVSLALLAMLHWFNPLLWLAFRRMALERELACDELALSWLKKGENKAYGRTILKLLETAPLRPPTFTTVGILEEYRQLVARMQGIARHGTSHTRPLVAIALLTIVALIGLSNAQTELSRKAGAGTAARESLTRTLHFTGAEAEASLSPDEARIVYSVWRDKGADLVVRDLRHGTTNSLTQVGTNWYFAETVVWSPDSSLIACTWYQDEADEIRVLSVDGRENKLVRAVSWKENSYPYLTDWSRDGKLYRKLDVHSRSQAAVRYLRWIR